LGEIKGLWLSALLRRDLGVIWLGVCGVSWGKIWLGTAGI